MKKFKSYRQGDVLIFEKEVLPKQKGKLKEDKIVAYGEVTGHKHQLIGGELYENEGVMYLKADAETSIVHEEHGTIKLPKGNYEIIIQREYDEQAWRNVAD